MCRTFPARLHCVNWLLNNAKQEIAEGKLFSPASTQAGKARSQNTSLSSLSSSSVSPSGSLLFSNKATLHDLLKGPESNTQHLLSLLVSLNRTELRGELAKKSLLSRMDELSQSLTPGKGRLLTEADVDVLLANDLNTLSFKERDFLYEEIHGVSEVIEETEELIQRSLAEMEQELRRIPEKPDYEEAMRRCPGYVEDRRFRLMFLRAKHFNTKEAAALLTRYLKGKRELFGDATLCRRVCYSDLDEDDKACLASGTYQWIPARDRAGRPIACDFMGLLPKGSYKRTENMVKDT